MSVIEELTRYIQKYKIHPKNINNSPPGAIPITKEEKELLKEEFRPYMIKDQKKKNKEIKGEEINIDEFCGVDIYIHPNAKEIRNIKI